MNFAAKWLVVLSALTLFLGGCTSTGSQQLAEHSVDTLKNSLVEGRTTTSEVKTLLGEPTTISVNSDKSEKWTYSHTKASPKVQNFIPLVNLVSRGADVTKRNLIVEFNPQGVLTSYSIAQTQNEVNSGIIP